MRKCRKNNPGLSRAISTISAALGTWEIFTTVSHYDGSGKFTIHLVAADSCTDQTITSTTTGLDDPDLASQMAMDATVKCCEWILAGSWPHLVIPPSCQITFQGGAA